MQSLDNGLYIHSQIERGPTIPSVNFEVRGKLVIVGLSIPFIMSYSLHLIPFCKQNSFVLPRYFSPKVHFIYLLWLVTKYRKWVNTNSQESILLLYINNNLWFKGIWITSVKSAKVQISDLRFILVWNLFGGQILEVLLKIITERLITILIGTDLHLVQTLTRARYIYKAFAPVAVFG